MKLTKENVCVLIENEAQLEEARKMLEKYGESIDESSFNLEGNFKYLKRFPCDPYPWFTQDKETINQWKLSQITLQQLEEILKQSK